jgi:predicted nucleic-acid-binding protein
VISGAGASGSGRRFGSKQGLGLAVDVEGLAVLEGLFVAVGRGDDGLHHRAVGDGHPAEFLVPRGLAHLEGGAAGSKRTTSSMTLDTRLRSACSGARRPGPCIIGQAMIGLNTHVLARYCVEDAADAEAQRQRVAARCLIESGQPLTVSETAFLGFEWVMSGDYGSSPQQVSTVLEHLLELRLVTVDASGVVEHAPLNCDAGIDLADALHHASYRACRSVATFDDRRLVRPDKKLGLTPAVMIAR